MPNLSDSLQCTTFVRRLEFVEGLGMQLREWESNFVKDMRRLFETREDAMDQGMTPWSPSVKQWNTLIDIEERYR